MKQKIELSTNPIEEKQLLREIAQQQGWIMLYEGFEALIQKARTNDSLTDDDYFQRVEATIRDFIDSSAETSYPESSE